MATETPLISGIAARYAGALFDLASEAKSIPAVQADLAGFQKLIGAHPDLARLVASPVFSKEEQGVAVKSILAKAGISGLAGNFIRMVAEKRRLSEIGAMTAAFDARVAEKNGQVVAEITVPAALSDKNRAAVVEALEASTSKKISLKEKIDPSLIGGLIVKIGSQMIDASLKTKLNSMKLSLKEVG